MVLKQVIFVKMKNLKDLNSFQNLNSSKRYYVRAVTHKQTFLLTTHRNDGHSNLVSQNIVTFLH